MWNARNLISASVVAFALMGCGANGKGVISNVAFSNSITNNELYVGLDATMASGGLVLPNVTLPLYNPKNPAQTLGTIQTNGTHIIVAVNATQALKLPGLVDGTKLPSGAAIPLVLPAGLTPVAIPAFNSNSLVYVAVSGQQIMLGVAVSILKQDGLNLPLNVFLPFKINAEISGTGGFFLGATQGVAVFALREPAAAPPTATIAKFASLASPAKASLTMQSIRSAAGATASGTGELAGRIEVKVEPLTNSKIRRLQRTWDSLDDVQID